MVHCVLYLYVLVLTGVQRAALSVARNRDGMLTMKTSAVSLKWTSGYAMWFTAAPNP